MSPALELGGWTEEDKEHVLAAFAATIDKITGKLLELRPDAPEDSALHYASGLVGAAVQAAQFWLAGGRRLPKADAEALVAALSWRGIASFPLQGESTPGTSAEIG